MKYIPEGVSRVVSRQLLITKKHSPKIMFVGGLVGVVAATVMACRATLKLEAVLDEGRENAEVAKTLQSSKYSEEDRSKDLTLIKVQTTMKVAKLYGPAVGIGILSVASLISSHTILSNRNASLTAAYVAIDKAYKEYRQRVQDEIGFEKERHIASGAKAVEIVGENGKKSVIQEKDPNSRSIYARFFDEASPSWQKNAEYNMAFLKCQQTFANDMLHARGHIFLNEIYDMLGIDRSGAGSVVGWIIGKDNDNYVDFGIYDKNDDRKRLFVNANERSILLDFNVDGVIYDKI